LHAPFFFFFFFFSFFFFLGACQHIALDAPQP
jgi:hypothetical protein